MANRNCLGGVRERVLGLVLTGTLGAVALAGCAGATSDRTANSRVTGPQTVAEEQQVKTQIEGGKPVTFIAGTLACTGAKVDFYVANPIVTTASNGTQLEGYVVADSNAPGGFDVVLFDMFHPGDPITPNLPACTFAADPADAGLVTGSLHQAELLPATGGADDYMGVNPANDTTYIDPAGNPIAIGEFYLPQK